MRRILLLLCLLLLAVPAFADETWTQTTDWGDVITYTQVDTEWGYILYNETDDWMVNFRYDSCTFAPRDDYVSVHDEMTGLQTFYRANWPSWATPEEVAALAQTVPSSEVAFVYDMNGEKLILPGVGEIDMPGTSSAIHDAYERGQRLFMTFTNFEGQHFLRIVTWQDDLDVRTIEMPWSGSFDTFHISSKPEDNDFFILYLDATEDFGYITANEVEGRWLLGGMNTGWEVVDFAPWGVSIDVNSHWAYGTHDWQDLETIDWNSFPLTYAEAVQGLQHEGWLFPKMDTPMYAAPDTASAVVVTCPQDTPLRVLRTEGEWVWVGLLDLEEWSGDFRTPPVGYVPLSELADQPETVLPGGEILGWFVTMTVEASTHYTEEYMLIFTPLDGYYEPFAITVAAGFAEAARAAYREKGYAVTPMGFDESLLPYLDAGYRLIEHETIEDAVLTDSGMLMAIRYEDGTWELHIESEYDTLKILMPGPFRFSRGEDWWGEYGIVFTE